MSYSQLIANSTDNENDENSRVHLFTLSLGFVCCNIACSFFLHFSHTNIRLPSTIFVSLLIRLQFIYFFCFTVYDYAYRIQLFWFHRARTHWTCVMFCHRIFLIFHFIATFLFFFFFISEKVDVNELREKKKSSIFPMKMIEYWIGIRLLSIRCTNMCENVFKFVCKWIFVMPKRRNIDGYTDNSSCELALMYSRYHQRK